MGERYKCNIWNCKIPGRKYRKSFHYTGLVSDFLAMTPKAQGRRAKLNPWNYIEVNASAQEIINRVKRQPLWEKMEEHFATNISDKELILQICKELPPLSCKKQKQKTKIPHEPNRVPSEVWTQQAEHGAPSYFRFDESDSDLIWPRRLSVQNGGYPVVCPYP